MLVFEVRSGCCSLLSLAAQLLGSWAPAYVSAELLLEASEQGSAAVPLCHSCACSRVVKTVKNRNMQRHGAMEVEVHANAEACGVLARVPPYLEYRGTVKLHFFFGGTAQPS